jgi:hypothetical protein
MPHIALVSRLFRLAATGQPAEVRLNVDVYETFVGKKLQNLVTRETML